MYTENVEGIHGHKYGALKKKYMNVLENAGFTEILETSEESGLRHAKEYYKKYHHLNIPCVCVCNDGYRLDIYRGRIPDVIDNFYKVRRSI